MSDTKNFVDTQRIGWIDIQNLLISVSPSTAKRYLSEIKETFNLKVVLYIHFKKYFKMA